MFGFANGTNSEHVLPIDYVVAVWYWRYDGNVTYEKVGCDWGWINDPRHKTVQPRTIDRHVAYIHKQYVLAPKWAKIIRPGRHGSKSTTRRRSRHWKFQLVLKKPIYSSGYLKWCKKCENSFSSWKENTHFGWKVVW